MKIQKGIQRKYKGQYGARSAPKLLGVKWTGDTKKIQRKYRKPNEHTKGNTKEI